jgi:hypothetical protein
MSDDTTHPHLAYVHEVRVRIVPASNKLLALSLMAREIARDTHAWWNTHTHTIFAFPTHELRDRFEAAAVEVVNGPELSWDEVVVRVGRVRMVRMG